MAHINTGSELLETALTQEELNKAEQLMDRDLAICYLQNTKVDIFRKLANQEFSDPADDASNHRIRAYHKGQLDLLAALIERALSPTPVSLDNSQTEG